MKESPPPFKIGDRLLDFEIRGLLGQGGHAHVFEAYDTFSDRNVAIKVIRKESDSGRDLAGRAQSEARVLVRVKHPNVIDFYHAGRTDDGDVYIVMEKLEGRSLRNILRDVGKLSIAEAVSLAIQVAEGVQAAHSQNVIHRDLKPDNIFVGTDNHVKVFDFGIAKVEGYAAHKTTQKRMLHGTLLYMSPEQLQGFPVTTQSDIFSLGTLLYESLYAHPALLNPEVKSVQQAAMVQITTLPPPLHELDPDIPRHLARLVQRAILKNPDERYASMAEFAKAAREVERRLVAERGEEFITSTTRNLLVVGTEPMQPAGRRDSQHPTVAEPRRVSQSGKTELIPVEPRESSRPSKTPDDRTDNLNRVAFEPTDMAQVRTSPLPPEPAPHAPGGVDVNATAPGIGVVPEAPAPSSGYSAVRSPSSPPQAPAAQVVQSPVRSPSNPPPPQSFSHDQRSRQLRSPLPRPPHAVAAQARRLGSDTTNVPVSSGFQSRPAGVPAPLMGGTNWKARGVLGLGLGLVLGVGYGVFTWSGAAATKADAQKTAPAASAVEPANTKTVALPNADDEPAAAETEPDVAPAPPPTAQDSPPPDAKARPPGDSEVKSPTKPEVEAVASKAKKVEPAKKSSKYNERLEWLERDLKQENKKQNTEKEEKPRSMPTEDEIWGKK